MSKSGDTDHRLYICVRMLTEPSSLFANTSQCIAVDTGVIQLVCCAMASWTLLGDEPCYPSPSCASAASPRAAVSSQRSEATTTILNRIMLLCLSADPRTNTSSLFLNSVSYKEEFNHRLRKMTLFSSLRKSLTSISPSFSEFGKGIVLGAHKKDP